MPGLSRVILRIPILTLHVGPYFAEDRIEEDKSSAKGLPKISNFQFWSKKMGLSIPHLLVVLAIVVLVFGTKRLKNVGADLGDAIKGFRNAVKESEEAEDPKAITQLYQEELSGDLIAERDRSKA